MFAAGRTVSRIAGASLATSLLVGTVATGAQAASPTVTLAQAKAALPSATTLPGHVVLLLKATQLKKATALPCSTNPKVLVPLAGAQVASASYGVKGVSLTSPKLVTYRVAIAVFPTTAKAQAATALLNKAEKTCPKTKTTSGGGESATVSRSAGGKTSVAGWTGYLAVLHVVATGPLPLNQRAYQTYLTRGNVIVSVTQLAANTTGSGPKQSKWYKAATLLVLKRVAS